MPRQAAILALARALRDANAEGDWVKLAALDRHMGQELQAMAAQRPWSAAELRALRALQALHAAMYQQCSDTKERLGQHLSDLRTNKEGRMEYALHSDTDQDGNPA